jgi:hypothetical protein
MEGKIVCFSAANNESRINYEKTVLNPVEIQELKNFFKLTEIPLNVECVSVWGVRWRKIWEKINSNDVALFYAHKRFIRIVLFKEKLKINILLNICGDLTNIKI